MDDFKEAENQRKRWKAEWAEKKASEMEIFTGKREVNINEGETASSISQSRVSNKGERASQIAK